MAKRKGKVKAGKPAKAAKAKAAKPGKKGKAIAAGKRALGVARKAEMFGINAGDVLDIVMPGKGGAGSPAPAGKGGKKRRKGRVPKTVRKWASRIVSRRKQEEKIVKKLFGAGGGKVVKAPKHNSSVGYITPQERARALMN